MAANVASYKVVLIGDSNTGKTTFAKWHRTGLFERIHVASLGVEIHPITYKNHTIIVWDTAGNPRFMGLADGYYIQADAAVAFYDVTNEESYNNVAKHVKAFKRVAPNAPVVIVANKCDLKSTMDHHTRNYDISTKTLHNLNKPFDHIIDLM